VLNLFLKVLRKCWEMMIVEWKLKFWSLKELRFLKINASLGFPFEEIFGDLDACAVYEEEIT
jgi:hypothetical protein